MNYRAFVSAVKREIKDIKPEDKAVNLALREAYEQIPEAVNEKDAQKYVNVFCVGYRGASRFHMDQQRARISGLISRLRFGERKISKVSGD